MDAPLETLMLALDSGGIPLSGPTFFLGARPHTRLTQASQLIGWQPFKPHADAWDATRFPRVDSPSGSHQLVLVLPGKSKDETLASFALAYDLLLDGGTLLASIANTAGADRFEKELKSVAGHITSFQKHKCRAFHATKSADWDQAKLDTWRQAGEPRTIPNTPFLVQPGIFSPDHLDPGSLLLTAHLPRSLRGITADLGAGWGYLSHWIGHHCPNIRRLDLHEADARALHFAQHNLQGIPIETHFHWTDVTRGLPCAYDTIVMNPPFHTGQETDISLGVQFVKIAAASLKPGGRLFLVANRQLPYERELQAAKLNWRKPIEQGTYKLLFAERTLK